MADLEPILIRGTRDPFGWLGNMSPFPVTYEDRLYRTTEALFQCLRLPRHHPAREIVRAEASPMAAKFAAKRYAPAFEVVPCSERDLDNMRLCLRLKLEQHPHLAAALAGTAPRPIIEDCTRRRGRGSALFWGAALEPDGSWVGENHLGRLWMEIRDCTG